MAYFLAKTDPGTYSLDDLEREGTTVWNGVRNPQAVQVIQSMRPGDTVLIYHSSGQTAIVGLAEVLSEPRPDPDDPKSAVVDVRFLRRLAQPVTLRQVKATHQFDNWSLIRQSRLSTMAVPEEFIGWMREEGLL